MSIVAYKHPVTVPIKNAKLCIGSNYPYSESYTILDDDKDFVVTVMKGNVADKDYSQANSSEISDEPKFIYGAVNAKTEDISDWLLMSEYDWFIFLGYLKDDALKASEFIETLIPKDVDSDIRNIKVNIVNAEGKRTSTTISKRIAQAYVKICTDIMPTDKNIQNEIQRLAINDKYMGVSAIDNDTLLDILVGRIEDKMIAIKQAISN